MRGLELWRCSAEQVVQSHTVGDDVTKGRAAGYMLSRLEQQRSETKAGGERSGGER